MQAAGSVKAGGNLPVNMKNGTSRRACAVFSCPIRPVPFLAMRPSMAFQPPAKKPPFALAIASFCRKNGPYACSGFSKRPACQEKNRAGNADA